MTVRYPSRPTKVLLLRRVETRYVVPLGLWTEAMTRTSEGRIEGRRSEREVIEGLPEHVARSGTSNTRYPLSDLVSQSVPKATSGSTRPSSFTPQRAQIKSLLRTTAVLNSLSQGSLCVALDEPIFDLSFSSLALPSPRLGTLDSPHGPPSLTPPNKSGATSVPYSGPLPSGTSTRAVGEASGPSFLDVMDPTLDRGVLRTWVSFSRTTLPLERRSPVHRYRLL